MLSTPDLTSWMFGMNADQHSLELLSTFIDVDGPDNVLGYTTANFGADDNFRVLAGSPTIDAGNPQSLYQREPSPNGNRVNLGLMVIRPNHG